VLKPVNIVEVMLGCLMGLGVTEVAARSVNGNDLALYYVESKTDAERQALLDEAGRRPQLFRYLQIMEMDALGEDGQGGFRITAMEPASGLDVVFTVTQRVSLRVLREEPVSERGRAVAVSGVIERVDPQTLAIHLNPVIVRHKDRLAPAVGKEMLYEIDDRGIFYSFSGGRETVQLSYRDRDLLRHRGRIMDEGGDQAWADFLTREIQRREAARRAERSGP